MQSEMIIASPIQKQYDGFRLEGKKKHLNDDDQRTRVIDAVQRIHRSVGWGDKNNRLSSRRLIQSSSRAVFALSSEGAIVGYAVARRDTTQIYYLSFIAVEHSSQRSGMGNALLLRLFEKVHKKGGELLNAEFRDEERLCAFYQNSSIPYKIHLQRKKSLGYPDDEGRLHDKNYVTYFLKERRNDDGPLDG